jgi:hypothetical protein
MDTAATRTRQNCTITGDFHAETTYSHLLGDGNAFLEWGLAFILSLSFQLKHKTTCRGGCVRTHATRAKLMLWAMQTEFMRRP